MYESYDLPQVDHTIFATPNAGDEKLHVTFYMNAVLHDGKSQEAGRPIYDDTECVRIIVPGDKNSIIDRPASAQDKARFPGQYAKFKAGVKEEDQLSGTRLSEWPAVSRAQVEELKFFGVRSVEQLADLREDVVARMPGVVRLKQLAAAWLARSKSTAEVQRTQKQLNDQQLQIEQLQEVVRRQGEKLEKAQHATA